MILVYLQREVFCKYPLWLAKYSTKKPDAPMPWGKINGWTFWQKSDKGMLHGTNVDLDYFKGSGDELLSFIRRTSRQ